MLEIDRINVQIDRFIKHTYPEARDVDYIEGEKKQILISSRSDGIAQYLVYKGLHKLDKLSREIGKPLKFYKKPQLGHKGYLGFYFVCEVDI